MKILITGATGFVGRNLIKSLIVKNKKDNILIITRDIQKATQILPYKDIQIVNIKDKDKIQAFNPEIIIHLAAKLTSANNSDIIEEIIDSNIKNGVKLLDALKGCKNLKLFINFGTFAEYRKGPDKINNAYLYSASKTAFRSFLEYYSDLCGYKYVNVIPYTIYGGKDSQKKVIDYIKDSIGSEIPIKMSGGEQVLDFIHVNDVVRFILYLMKFYKKRNNYLTLENGETYFLGSGNGISLRELAKKIELKTGKTCNIAWGALPYRERDIMYAVAPIHKILNIGWKPQHSLISTINNLKINLISHKSGDK